jgi:hypothetical protein
LNLHYLSILGTMCIIELLNLSKILTWFLHIFETLLNLLLSSCQSFVIIILIFKRKRVNLEGNQKISYDKGQDESDFQEQITFLFA